MADAQSSRATDIATGILVLADGTVIHGRGFGAEGSAVGEVCFNTAMTGYQEVMTDPSYAGQMVTFTFPHIGNVGSNPEDLEATNPHALGCIVREDVTAPSNFRSTSHFDQWMKINGRIGLAGVDTRALTRRIREAGAPNAVIAHSAKGDFDVPALLAQARAWSGLEGIDLAKQVSTLQTYAWDEGLWTLGQGYATGHASEGKPHVVAVDYGLKRNILRNLVAAGARVTVVPATATYDDIAAHKPDGVFLSNGPGDPAATGGYAVPVIQQLIAADTPIFGICLGHQLLGLAAGAKTVKMFQGHRGANHPVKRLEDGRVEITSMNHGFAVDADTLPANA
ncbi:glutamine-hydrolyzing carbamoyl-phosphate synthase small subunit, partial [Sphingomonas sp.]|uniref:glutamine-hydrolyzing carbamoyl-phosphate synthase small subunit n=1 Tax=Sphingomonas sp. TaxID=28214 RepID=UPI0025D0E5A7